MNVQYGPLESLITKPQLDNAYGLVVNKQD